MHRVLKQLIGRQRDARALVTAISEALGAPVTIEDAEGRLLYGDAPSGTASIRVPVTHLGASLGWVAGPPHARTVAAVLDHLVARETEKKALGTEVLHLYREINLIYSFSEKLASLLELERVARLTLDEARQVIVASDGVLMLLDQDTEILTTIAGFGTSRLSTGFAAVTASSGRSRRAGSARS